MKACELFCILTSRLHTLSLYFDFYFHGHNVLPSPLPYPTHTRWEHFSQKKNSRVASRVFDSPFAFMQASPEQICAQCNILIKRHSHVRGAESKDFASILRGWQSAWFLSSSDYWHTREAGPTGVNYHTIPLIRAQSDYFYLGMKAPWGASPCTSLWWVFFFFWGGKNQRLTLFLWAAGDYGCCRLLRWIQLKLFWWGIVEEGEVDKQWKGDAEVLLGLREG